MTPHIQARAKTIRTLDEIADSIEHYGRDLIHVQGYGMGLIRIAEEVRNHPDNRGPMQ